MWKVNNILSEHTINNKVDRKINSQTTKTCLRIGLIENKRRTETFLDLISHSPLHKNRDFFYGDRIGAKRRMTLKKHNNATNKKGTSVHNTTKLNYR
jgi:hypothetical protein